MSDMQSELRQAEFRVALRRITEHYPPDTIAGRLAADVLAKYPTGFEGADRENDSEPFEVEEIKGLPHGPMPNNTGPMTQDNMVERVERLLAENAELRAERDALLQKPIDLAKMDSIDDYATDRMIAYYWWQQAQEARAAIATMHGSDSGALREALGPFASFAADNVDDEGWNEVGLSTKDERIVDWFGPSDFRRARNALTKLEGGR